MKLDRDVIFLAEAGEEGTTRVGIDYMVEQHWGEIEAEYALAEGGSTFARDGKVRYVGISATEKIPRPVHLVAHGHAGHGSRPTPDNAVLRIADGSGESGDMAGADAAERHHPTLLRAARHDQFAGRRLSLQPHQRSTSAPSIEKYFSQHEL